MPRPFPHGMLDDSFALHQSALNAVQKSIQTIQECIEHSKRCLQDSREALVRESRRAGAREPHHD